MSEEEVRARTNEKINDIKALASKLKIRIVPKQVITKQQTIEMVVFFIDEEDYPVDRIVPPSPAQIKKAISALPIDTDLQEIQRGHPPENTKNV